MPEQRVRAKRFGTRQGRWGVAPRQLWAVTGFVLRRAAGRLLAPVLALPVPRRLPVRLLLAPQDIRAADPRVATAIYAGHYVFGGRALDAHGRTPFDLAPPGRAWSVELHGFGWLRHLRAADTALARANARALVGDWMAGGTGRDPVAWEPAVVARRLISWLSHSPVILDGADEGFNRALMRSLMGQGAVLQGRLRAGLDGTDRLWAAVALAVLHLCIDRPLPARRPFATLLAELGRQILPDGGHISRDPAVLSDLLLDLLPLREAFAARGAAVPPALLTAVDRMMPMLRLFRHEDGALALFNGMGPTPHAALAAVLAHDDQHATPLANAPHSGYQRLALGAAVAVVDTGVPPPLGFSHRAHAGALSFEFTVGEQRLVVNCGHPAGQGRAMAAAARTTAAHSTLVVNDTPSAHRVVRGHRLGLAGALVPGPRSVVVAREGVAALEASHDGYAALGLVHHRALALAAEGWRLAGVDTLLVAVGAAPPPPGTAVALRFHLHPSVRPRFHPDGESVILGVGGDIEWVFAAAPHEVGVEESIFFGDAEGPRRSEQVVVRTTLGAGPGAWTLAAQMVPRPAAAPGEAAPEPA